jgi:hypothetical protein
MKLTNKILLVAGFILAITIASCSKQGDPGPAGASGKDGINGVNGTNGADGKDGTNGTNGTDGTNGKDGTNGTDGKDGTNGKDGKDGNANVIGSDPFTTNTGTWTNGGGYFTANFTANIITQEVADKGVVMCYQSLGNGIWLPLPTSYWTFYFSKGSIELFYGDATNPGAQTFRIVAIAPSQLARYPNLDLKDYEQVSRVLKITE